MDKNNTETVKLITDFLLKSSGADVVAPAELKDRIVKRFITEGPGKKIQKEFEYLTEMLGAMSPEEQEAAIKTLTFTILKPSVYGNICIMSKDIFNEHMTYLDEHPEYKQKTDADNLENLIEF